MDKHTPETKKTQAQCDEEIVNLTRLVRKGKRLEDAADTIEHFYNGLVSIGAERDRLKAVNAELVKALEQAERCLSVPHSQRSKPRGNGELTTLNIVRDAIAKAKGAE